MSGSTPGVRGGHEAGRIADCPRSPRWLAGREAAGRRSGCRPTPRGAPGATILWRPTRPIRRLGVRAWCLELVAAVL